MRIALVEVGGGRALDLMWDCYREKSKRRRAAVDLAPQASTAKKRLISK